MAQGYWARLQRDRITRRRLLQGTALGAAGAAGAWALAACGGGGEEGGATPGASPTGAVETPKYGGRYLLGTDVNIDTLDPHISIAGGVGYFPRIYNVLVAQSAVNPDFFFFDLAESYEHPDDTTYIFKIRPGVKIAPNNLGISERDMDAEDAYVSFERIKNLEQANAAVFVNDWFASHEASENNTIYTVKTPKPYAWFLMRMSFFINTIPPRELIQDNPDRMKQVAVGGGPYFVTSYVEGQNLNLDKNPNYYRTDENNNNAKLPYIDGIDVRIIPDRAALRTAFLSKQSYQYGAENRAEAEQLLNQNSQLWQGEPQPVFTFISFTMNVTRKPWDDPRVRKAAMYAINRQQYIDIVYKGDAKPNGLVHWPTGAYALSEDELNELQPYDPERSKQLIQEAGYQLPLKIKVMYPANSTIEEHNAHLPIFLEQMRAAGFEVEQDPQDFGTWLNNYTDKNYDASLALNQVYETPEIPLDFHHSRGPAGDNIYATGLQDPEVDKAIEDAKSITDPEELVKAIHDVQKLIYEKGPMFLPIVSPFSRTLYWNFVKNVPQGLGATGLLINTTWLDL